MPGKVVDASVLGALVFNEPRASEAASLLANSELYAPTLLAYELASIAGKKIHLYPEQIDVLLQALEIALALEITWVEVDHPAVARLALDTNLTTYHACYLYLSRFLGFPLITFDERLRTASQ